MNMKSGSFSVKELVGLYRVLNPVGRLPTVDELKLL